MGYSVELLHLPCTLAYLFATKTIPGKRDDGKSEISEHLEDVPG
jgi:hypothetical protein